jgi:hypothetical protein
MIQSQRILLSHLTSQRMREREREREREKFIDNQIDD